jgi:hypothetical protein
VVEDRQSCLSSLRSSPSLIETTGRPVRVELSAVAADGIARGVKAIDLGAFEHRVVSSGGASVSATAGEGRVFALGAGGVAANAKDEVKDRGLNWKGPWVSTTAYVVDDAVSYNGSSSSVRPAATTSSRIPE